MSRLLENVAKARDKLAPAQDQFRKSLVAAKTLHTWQEIADVANLSVGGVRWHVNQRTKKGEK
jgi:hypothetical protein